MVYSFLLVKWYETDKYFLPVRVHYTSRSFQEKKTSQDMITVSDILLW
jgi:hypothetical protein